MPIVLKSGSLNLLEPSGPVQACNGVALLGKLCGNLILHSVVVTLVSINSGFITCQLTNGKIDGRSELHRRILLQLLAVKASEVRYK